MANGDKKPDKKEKPKGWNFDIVELFIILLILAALLGSLIPAIWGFATSGSITFFGYSLGGFLDFFKNNLGFLKALGFSVAGLSAVGTFSFTKLGDAVWRAERLRLFPSSVGADALVPVGGDVSDKAEKTIDRWREIVRKSESENSSDWRLAIIEADIMLDDLLMQLHLPGETMGDKLKSVEKSDFTTIDFAWEAHKARNMIAHEGSDFLLNQRETRRIISLYEAVFKEFQII